MKMYQEVKNIYKCNFCGAHFGRRDFEVAMGLEYACSFCASKMDLQNEETQKDEEHEKRKSMIEEMVKHIGTNEKERKQSQKEEKDEVKQEKRMANYEGYAYSVHELAEGQGWSSSLRQCVSAIRQNKWYPTRNKIISLGLHLSMERDQIDEMLELAHMEPLCAKNIFESVILFILEDASLNNMMDAESEDFDPDELCRYAREVLSELDLPEVESFISELPEEENEW